MILTAVVALSENNAIGKDGKLPWHLPDDLKFFKKMTLGKPVLMGRKTFESLGKPLVNRLNIVVSSQKDLELPEGVLLYDNIKEAMARLEAEGTDEGCIIGGGDIFRQLLPQIERIYLTMVHTVIAGADAFFPHIDHTHWKLTWQEEHAQDEKHAYSFTFQQWDRVREI